jgi:hypothetical protein
MHDLPRRPVTLPSVTTAAGRLVLLAGLLVTIAAPVAAAERPADICFETVSGTLEDAEWEAMRELVAATAATRPALFPLPVLTLGGSRLDIASGHEGLDAGARAACLVEGHEWTARYDRAFLQAGAQRLLAEAPTTPGISSAVIIEWHPTEARLRTLLDFSGPFDIPNGRCWIDDVLEVDETGGVIVARAERGLATSPFAESACTRFYDHLPGGGAGEQAVSLLPAELPGHDGSIVRFVAESVAVLDDAIVVGGSVERAE